ncbi:hypothetical protein FA13DRAFT_1707653 [Coprinellus micaceus]|uniref:Uncharacterized protein n=1 Tax=Coprinellus micaceus TaxID=71717 RepID=A0A4Y7TJ81_COPMI|nr:hypothetical protein FA13DRAFT_1707653 [Coprinellus micaceus]
MGGELLSQPRRNGRFDGIPEPTSGSTKDIELLYLRNALRRQVETSEIHSHSMAASAISPTSTYQFGERHNLAKAMGRFWLGYFEGENNFESTDDELRHGIDPQPDRVQSSRVRIILASGAAQGSVRKPRLPLHLRSVPWAWLEGWESEVRVVMDGMKLNSGRFRRPARRDSDGIQDAKCWVRKDGGMGDGKQQAYCVLQDKAEVDWNVLEPKRGSGSTWNLRDVGRLSTMTSEAPQARKARLPPDRGACGASSILRDVVNRGRSTLVAPEFRGQGAMGVSPPGGTESQLKELRVKRGFSGGLCDEGTPCGYGLRWEMRELNCNYCEGMMAGEAAIADVDSQGRTLNHVGAMGHLDSPRNVFDWGAAATVKEVLSHASSEVREAEFRARFRRGWSLNAFGLRGGTTIIFCSHFGSPDSGYWIATLKQRSQFSSFEPAPEPRILGWPCSHLLLDNVNTHFALGCPQRKAITEATLGGRQREDKLEPADGYTVDIPSAPPLHEAPLMLDSAVPPGRLSVLFGHPSHSLTHLSNTRLMVAGACASTAKIHRSGGSVAFRVVHS